LDGIQLSNGEVYFRCSACGLEHSVDKFNSKRFCQCGKFLTIKDKRVRVANALSNGDEKDAIADYVLSWYEKWRINNKEVEQEILAQLNTDSPKGRFEVAILAILFSMFGMEESRAFAIWRNIRNWFNSKGYDYTSVFSMNNPPKLKEFKNDYNSLGVPQKFLSNTRFIDYVKFTLNELSNKYNGDLNGLVDETDWRKTITRLQNSCKGVSQKAFWIVRVMNQKGDWLVPNEFCCVSDSHVKAFLSNSRFTDDVTDLFKNSKIMWLYFNEGKPKKYYDLAIFRLAREGKPRCKDCAKVCNLATLMKCRPL
jgi:hypothetical protein